MFLFFNKIFLASAGGLALVGVVAGSAGKFYSSQQENKKVSEEELLLEIKKLQEEMEINNKLSTEKEKEEKEDEVPEVTAPKTPPTKPVDPYPNAKWDMGYLLR